MDITVTTIRCGFEPKIYEIHEGITQLTLLTVIREKIDPMTFLQPKENPKAHSGTVDKAPQQNMQNHVQELLVHLCQTSNIFSLIHVKGKKTQIGQILNIREPEIGV